MKLSSGVARGLRAGFVLAGSIAACSANKTNGLSDGTGDGNGGSSGGNDSTSSGGGGGGSGGSSGSGASSGNGVFQDTSKDASTPIAFDAACATSTQTGQQQGLDAYIMLDYSGSMKQNGKWTGITAAINSFVAEPSSGISVGMQYFGLPNTDADAGNILGVPVGDSCDPATYAMPAIEISPLPGIASTITSRSPGTPTRIPARRPGRAAGRHRSREAWASAHPEHVTIVDARHRRRPERVRLAATTQPLSQVETVAAAGVAATPKILTFVIGVGSSSSRT